MAAIMRSTDFRSITEPVLNKAYDGVANIRVDEAAKFTETVQGIPRNYHEEPYIAGLVQAQELPDGTPVQYSSGGTLYTARWEYKVYGAAFALTKVLVEDGDHIRLGEIYAEHLSTSMKDTDQTLAANLLNLSFNAAYVGGDGQPLCSNAHPFAPAYGGTFSNTFPAAALSQTSLEQALIQIKGFRDSAGKFARYEGKQLIVSRANAFQAEVLLKSALRSGSAENDINPLNGYLPDGALVVTRLTSPTAWWIQTDAPRGLTKYDRRKAEKSMEGDFETDSMRYKSTMRFVYGYTEPRCVLGNVGQ